MFRMAIPGGPDTIYLSVIGGEGNACSFLNSLFAVTGTGLVVPGTGVSLQNRGKAFLLDPNHPNALEPNKHPCHTNTPTSLSLCEAPPAFLDSRLLASLL
jgi:gamma-glutamyltranspeptidase/glutathione hydrolase